MHAVIWMTKSTHKQVHAPHPPVLRGTWSAPHRRRRLRWAERRDEHAYLRAQAPPRQSARGASRQPPCARARHVELQPWPVRARSPPAIGCADAPPRSAPTGAFLPQQCSAQRMRRIRRPCPGGTRHQASGLGARLTAGPQRARCRSCPRLGLEAAAREPGSRWRVRTCVVPSYWARGVHGGPGRPRRLGGSRTPRRA